MNINKEFLLKNLITICCLASILLLLLPFCSVTGSVSSAYIGSASDSESVNGFDMIFGETGTALGWLLILCPAVLVAMNYIEPLKKYKSVLALVLPIVSLVAQIATLSITKRNMIKAMGGSDTVSGYGTSVSMKVSPSIGFYLLIVACIATFIAGAMTYHGLTLDKQGISEFGNKIKDTGKNGLASAKDLGGKLAQKTETVTAKQPAATASETSAQESEQKMSSEDALVLLQNLSKMKESGILTEEEFDQKKQELLNKI